MNENENENENENYHKNEENCLSLNFNEKYFLKKMILKICMQKFEK